MYKNVPKSLVLGKVNPQETSKLFFIEGTNTYVSKYLDYSRCNKLTPLNIYFLISTTEIITVIHNLMKPNHKPIFITRSYNNFSIDFYQLIKDLPYLANEIEFEQKEWKLCNWFLTMSEKLPEISFNRLIENGY